MCSIEVYGIRTTLGLVLFPDPSPFYDHVPGGRGSGRCTGFLTAQWNFKPSPQKYDTLVITACAAVVYVCRPWTVELNSVASVVRTS